MNREDFIPPKHGAPQTEAAFSHELPSSRNWEKALDAIHNLLLTQQFYIATASNTHGGLLNRADDRKINLNRKKKDLPEEMVTIIAMKMATFKALNDKIAKTTQASGAERDIWRFTSKWKELPSGTAIIQIRQRPQAALFFENVTLRRAFIILDGEANIADQNQCMRTISKVLSDDNFANEALDQAKETPPVEVKPKKRKSTIYQGRPPGELILLLRDNFKANVRKVSIDEYASLGFYFKTLKKKGEMAYYHSDIKQNLDEHFSSKQKKE